jgi:hypothetical protein
MYNVKLSAKLSLALFLTIISVVISNDGPNKAKLKLTRELTLKNN